MGDFRAETHRLMLGWCVTLALTHPTAIALLFLLIYYDRGLTLANFLGIISSWKNVSAYRLFPHHFQNTDYTD